MTILRRFMTGAGVLLGTAAISMVGPAPSMAAPSPAPASAGGSHVTAPDPAAPHVGQVAGLRTGDQVTVNNPDSVRAFEALHESMREQVAGGSTSSGGGSDGVGPDTIHTYLGTSFNSDTVGAQATHSVSLKLAPAQAGTTLYMPTIYPSGNSCIEMTTAYFHSKQVVAAWDWCQAITFVAEVSIDRSFKQTYTQHRNYSVQVIQTDASSNTWTAYLYNYTTGAWEQFFAQGGSSQVGLSEGWDIYELYSDIQGDGTSYACTDLGHKRVEAQDILVGVDGTLVPADPTNAGDDYDVPISQFQCPTLKYKMVDPYDHWKARG